MKLVNAKYTTCIKSASRIILGMDKEPTSSRKTITLSDAMWEAIADFRFKHRVRSEAEAVRQLIEIALAEENTTSIGLVDKRRKRPKN